MNQQELVRFIERDEQGCVRLTASLLDNLKKIVQSGLLSKDELKQLAYRVSGSQVGQKIQRYLYLGQTEALEFDEKEILGTLIYKSTQDVQGPVFQSGQLISADKELIYLRPWIPELLIMHWKDERIQRTNNMEQIRYLAKRYLDWNGTTYQLVADSERKSYYFEEGKLPAWLQPWVESKLPQHKADLKTLLKRPGRRIKSLDGIRLSVDQLRRHTFRLWDGSSLDIFAEQGAWVLEKAIYRKLAKELGVHTLTGFQGTVLFENGTFFKGALLPTELGLEAGIYGGIKWAPGYKGKETRAHLASVMNSFAHYPWKPSLNRQQTDYAEAWDELPIRVKSLNPEIVQLALTGLPMYVKQFNNSLLSAASRLFRKIDVKGFAGQVALGKCPLPDVQFQVYLNPDKYPAYREQNGRILKAAWLPNPSLPINLDIPCVNIELVITDQVYDSLVVLNMSEDNLEFVGNIYMATGQDDGDGDGSTLDIEKEHVQKAVPWKKVRFHNTLQYKTQKDVESVDAFAAIDVAFTRSLKSRDIGKGDKLMRRIIREYPEAVTNELQTIVTKYIQQTISSQKKFTGDVDATWGQIWQIIPNDIRQVLHTKTEEGTARHDRIDKIKEKANALINARLALKHTKETEKAFQLEALNHAQQDFEQTLESVRESMPGHFAAAIQLLSLQQEPDPEVYARIRRKGEELLTMSLRKGLEQNQSKQVEEAFRAMHTLWRSVQNEDGDGHRKLNYVQAADIIRQNLIDLIQEVGPEAVYGSMLVGPVRFSDSMLSHCLGLDDLNYLDKVIPGFKLLNGLFLPIAKSNARIQSGGQVTVKELRTLIAHPVFLRALDNQATYQIKTVKPFRAVEWMSYKTGVTKYSLAILHLIKI